MSSRLFLLYLKRDVMYPFLIFILLAIPLHAFDLLTSVDSSQMPRCLDLHYLATKQILKYEQQQQSDSAFAVSDQLVQLCGMSDAIFEYTALHWALRDSLWIDRTLAKTALSYFQAYMDMQNERNAQTDAFHGFPKLKSGAHPSFDSLLFAMAKQIEGSRFRALHFVYSNRFPEYREYVERSGSEADPIVYAYRLIQSQQLRGGRLWGNIKAGYLWTFGNMHRLGHRAVSGITIAGGYGNVDVGMDATILMPSDQVNYLVEYEGELREGEGASGVVSSIELSYDFLKSRDWKVSVQGAAGMWMTNAYFPSDPELPTVDLMGPVFSLGVAWKRYLGELGFVSIHGAYQIADIHNPQGTPVFGNSISLQVRTGFEGNMSRVYARWLAGKEMMK